jgi:hypothetical protein
VLLNEGAETVALASSAGFRRFTDVQAFREYVQQEILANEQDQGSSDAAA